MNAIVDWLKGKKTYLVMISAAITALVSYLDGALNGKELVAALFAVLTGSTLRAGITKSGLVPLLISVLVLSTTPGCVTAINSQKVRSMTVRGKGLKLTAPDGTGIIFGVFTCSYMSIPVSTNGPVYAPRYGNALGSSDTWSPWSDTWAESVFSGDVMVNTNATGGAIIPKLRPVDVVK